MVKLILTEARLTEIAANYDEKQRTTDLVTARVNENFDGQRVRLRRFTL